VGYFGGASAALAIYQRISVGGVREPAVNHRIKRWQTVR
jgi:hypothetical protein